jgi:hypothetical protein
MEIETLKYDWARDGRKEVEPGEAKVGAKESTGLESVARAQFNQLYLLDREPFRGDIRFNVIYRGGAHGRT